MGSRETVECHSQQTGGEKGLCQVRFQPKNSEGSLGKAGINSGLVVSDAGLEEAGVN